ncbi:MAG: hypothetical protein OES25_16875 [Acidobacteriota bacterium]|nr:hypothetical protein [Acidobacteriota bacterium]
MFDSQLPRQSGKGGEQVFKVVRNGKHGGLVADVSAWWFSTEQAQENARLIAAAPDLLAACEGLLWKLNHQHSESGKGDDCKPATVDRKDAAVRAVITAVRKARGE